jgi:hypothetical protein
MQYYVLINPCSPHFGFASLITKLSYESSRNVLLNFSAASYFFGTVRLGIVNLRSYTSYGVYFGPTTMTLIENIRVQKFYVRDVPRSLK